MPVWDGILNRGRRSAGLRLLIVAVALTTITAGLLHVWELWHFTHAVARVSRSLVMVRLAYTAYALVASTAAIAVVRAAWHTAPARVLALYLACAGFSINAMALSSVLSPEIWGWSTLAFRLAGVAAAFGLAAIVRFSQLFPNPITDRDQRWLWVAGAVLALLFATGVIQLSLIFSIAAIAVTGTLTAWNLRTGYRRADEMGRRQVEWILMAVVTGLALILFDAALMLAELLIPGFSVPVLAWDVWLLILGLGLGLVFILAAVFYRGALDPALLIRRTVITATVAPMLVFMFAGVENIVANVLAARLGFDASVGGWIAGGTVALAFGPLREGLNKLFRSERAQLQKEP